MSHPELDPRDAEIARLKEQLRCMRSREEMAIQLLQNIAEALGYEVCENPQFLAPEIAGLVKRLGDLKQQLAAAEADKEMLRAQVVEQQELTDEASDESQEHKERLAAAESALTAEQALSEQMRAALDRLWRVARTLIENGHNAHDQDSAWAEYGHDLTQRVPAAIAITPTDALRKRLLEVAEKAYNEGWLRDAFWQASETRRALEEEK